MAIVPVSTKLGSEVLITMPRSRPITAIRPGGRVSGVDFQFGTGQASGRGRGTGVVVLAGVS